MRPGNKVFAGSSSNQQTLYFRQLSYLLCSGLGVHLQGETSALGRYRQPDRQEDHQAACANEETVDAQLDQPAGERLRKRDQANVREQVKIESCELFFCRKAGWPSFMSHKVTAETRNVKASKAKANAIPVIPTLFPVEGCVANNSIKPPASMGTRKISNWYVPDMTDFPA